MAFYGSRFPATYTADSPFLEARRNNDYYSYSVASDAPAPHPKPQSAPSFFSAVVPKLRRLDGGTERPSPLLILKLSSSSFLDSVVRDDRTQEALYVITTVGRSTTIKRPTTGGQNDFKITAADIKWPRTGTSRRTDASDGIDIQLGGARWKGSEMLLRHGTPQSSSRKFNIPNYSHTLKWKGVGTSYWCLATAVKGPVAIFEPSMAYLPGKLTIFENLQNGHHIRSKHAYHGVSLGLLDYLLLTSLLLVTDVREWMSITKVQSTSFVVPSIDKKGQTIIPKSISDKKSKFTKEFHSQVSPPVCRGCVLTSTSTNEVPTLVHDRDRDSSSTHLSFILGELDDYIFFSPILAPPFSPSSESTFFPEKPSSAPSHTCLDPSFYTESYISSTSCIPDRGRSLQASLPSSRSSSESSASSSKFRILPTPPVSPAVQAKSTSPRPDIPLCTSAPSTPPRSLRRRLPRPSPILCGRPRSQSQPRPHISGQRMLPSPPIPSSRSDINNSTGGPIHCVRSSSSSSIRRRNAFMTGPTSRHRPSTSTPFPGGFDAPPAYNSIAFHEGVEQASLPPPLPIT